MLNNSYEVKLVIKSVFLVLKENNLIFYTLTIETNDYVSPHSFQTIIKRANSKWRGLNIAFSSA